MAGTPIAKLVDAINNVELLQFQLKALSVSLDSLTRRVEAIERILMQRSADEPRP